MFSCSFLQESTLPEDNGKFYFSLQKFSPKVYLETLWSVPIERPKKGNKNRWFTRLYTISEQGRKSCWLIGRMDRGSPLGRRIGQRGLQVRDTRLNQGQYWMGPGRCPWSPDYLRQYCSGSAGMPLAQETVAIFSLNPRSHPILP